MDLLGKSFALLSALLWAFAVILFKKAGFSIRPMALNLYKTIIAVILILPLFWVLDIPLVPDQLQLKDWLIVSASGILGIAIADSLFFKCLNLLGAGLTAIVECLYSPFVIFLSWLVLTNPVQLHHFAGAALVVAAVLVATLKTHSRDSQPQNIILGIVIGSLAMLSMAYGIILMTPILQKVSVFWVTEVRLLAATAVLLGMIWQSRDRQAMLRSLWQRGNWRHAFPGTIIGNFLAMTLWVAAFKLTDVNSAAILNQTTTIFIVILAVTVLKEPFTRRRLIATLLGMGGSVLVLLQ